MQILFWFPVFPSDLSRKTDKPASGCASLFFLPRQRKISFLPRRRAHHPAPLPYLERPPFPAVKSALDLLVRGAFFDLRQGDSAAGESQRPRHRFCAGAFSSIGLSNFALRTKVTMAGHTGAAPRKSGFFPALFQAAGTPPSIAGLLPPVPDWGQAAPE